MMDSYSASQLTYALKEIGENCSYLMQISDDLEQLTEEVKELNDKIDYMNERLNENKK